MSERVHILLVDDEVGILETLQILFRNEGYEVTSCASGPEALDR
ncbi:MAG: DNA-binding response regulator, partial [Gemmatimonadetes bacterium]|nr:DNA-binding response regulator [Gemmatimonadota bacterium]